MSVPELTVGLADNTRESAAAARVWGVLTVLTLMVTLAVSQALSVSQIW